MMCSSRTRWLELDMHIFVLGLESCDRFSGSKHRCQRIEAGTRQEIYACTISYMCHARTETC